MVSFVNRVKEIIGMTNNVIRFAQTSSNTDRTPTISVARTDYSFWDKTRRGRSKGLELSGLFVKPITSKITEWAFNDAPTVETETDATNTWVASWMDENYTKITAGFRESLDLGDSYVLVNPDMSMVVLSPDTVNPIVDQNDYSKIIGWRVRNVYPDPNAPGSTMVIIEEFTEKTRTRTVIKRQQSLRGKFRDANRVESTFKQTFPNLIGMVPIIPIPNENSSSEKFGRPQVEALLHLLYKYDEVIVAAIQGNKKQGRPTPTVSGLGSSQEVQKFMDRYGKSRTRTLPDGRIEREIYFEFDSDKMMILGGTSNFKWESPGSFSTDTQNILGLLFYLIVQHAEIPEYALGTAIQSSKGSASTQVEPLVKFIDYKRYGIEPWLKDLIRVAVAYKSLSDSSISVDDLTDMTLHWANLTREDGALTLKAVQWSYSQGFLDDVEALQKTPIDIVDAKKSVAKGHAGFADRVGRTNVKSGSIEKQNTSNPQIDKQENPSGTRPGNANDGSPQSNGA